MGIFKLGDKVEVFGHQGILVGTAILRGSSRWLVELEHNLLSEQDVIGERIITSIIVVNESVITLVKAN